jgi:hypothetical protein
MYRQQNLNQKGVNMYEIQRLVKDFIQDKGIKKSEFVKKLGYTNLSKGCRNLQDFLEGDLSLHFIITHLHLAMEVDKAVIAKAMQVTEEEIEQERLQEREKRRACFKPILYVYTERRIPSWILACAMCGFHRFKRIALPDNFNELSRKSQNEIIKEKIAESMAQNNGTIITFGKILHYILQDDFDDTPEERRAFDTQGKEITHIAVEQKCIFHQEAVFSMR